MHGTIYSIRNYVQYITFHPLWLNSIILRLCVKESPFKYEGLHGIPKLDVPVTCWNLEGVFVWQMIQPRTVSFFQRAIHLIKKKLSMQKVMLEKIPTLKPTHPQMAKLLLRLTIEAVLDY